MLGLMTDARARRDDWSDDNARGLAHAAAGAWSDAADAFASAAELVDMPGEVAAHDALALVLGNLAQASFRAGRVDDGIRHAQRACSLRAALFGEDAIAVARARADLAVMLGSVGRAHEALDLMTRAIAGIERSAGDEDLRLSSVLENAARLAMAAGQPSTAEPYLIRLHALLAAHDLTTEAADVLLARVSSYRERESQQFARQRAADVDVAPMPETPDISDTDERDDQPLRDAVRITEGLLRTTPIHSRAITPPPGLTINSDRTPIVQMVETDRLTTPSAGVVGLDFELIDHTVVDLGAVLMVEPETALAVIDAPLSDDIFGDSIFDLVDVSAVGFDGDDCEVATSAASPHDVLGFVVEYGSSVEPIAPEDDMIVLPTAKYAQSPAAQSPAAQSPAALPTLSVSIRATPRGTPIVMPSPAASHRAVKSHGDKAHGRDVVHEHGRDGHAPRLTLHHSDDLDSDRRIRRPNIRAGRASTPRSSRGRITAGLVTAAITALAGWLAWSGSV